MLDSCKMVEKHSMRFCGIFPSLKQNSIPYRSSKESDCILEIHQLWQSDFSRVYSNCCCSCLFKSEIIKIGQSSHKMYSSNIVNFQESMPILNVCTKKVWNLIDCTAYIYIYIVIHRQTVSLYHNSSMYGLTCGMFQAGIETRLTFHQFDILPERYPVHDIIP